MISRRLAMLMAILPFGRTIFLNSQTPTTTGTIVTWDNKPLAWRLELDQMKELQVSYKGNELVFSVSEVFEALKDTK